MTAFESAFEVTDTHDPLCGQHCPGPGVGKCRGGDCTLCDEVDCQCDLIRAAREPLIEAVRALAPFRPAVPEREN